ncbi:MAG: hypothetical protein ACYDD9_06440 [Acidithiobacillus sp.]
MDRQELLWRQYQQNVDLYKFYMDLTIKFNVFFYAATGAIVSYVLAQHNGNDLIQYALVLPLVMSLCFGCFFVYGAVLMGAFRRDIFAIRDALQLQVAPDVRVLSVLLYVFAFVFLLIAIGCGVLLCFANGKF